MQSIVIVIGIETQAALHQAVPRYAWMCEVRCAMLKALLVLYAVHNRA